SCLALGLIKKASVKQVLFAKQHLQGGLYSGARFSKLICQGVELRFGQVFSVPESVDYHVYARCQTKLVGAGGVAVQVNWQRVIPRFCDKFANNTFARNRQVAHGAKSFFVENLDANSVTRADGFNNL